LGFPDALHNLIDDPKYQKVATKYRQMLRRHLEEAADPQLSAFDRLIAESTVNRNDLLVTFFFAVSVIALLGAWKMRRS
jgi:hypothetical protein